MTTPKGMLLTLLIVTVLSRTCAESGVHIRSKYLNELITSSTLKWVSAENGFHSNATVVGAIEIVQGKSRSVTYYAETWLVLISKFV